MIHCRVQHHPAREQLLPPLLTSLEGLPTEVIAHSSTPPSPWAGYRLCLSDIPDCTHVLVIQDDAFPQHNAVPAIRRIAASNPHTPVCLWLGPMPKGTVTYARRAMLRGQCYAPFYPVSPFVSLVALLWPRHKAEEFMGWADSGVKLRGHPRPRADDAIVAQWMQRTKQQIMVTVPSIFEHLTVPSVKGMENYPSSWKAALLAEDADAYAW